MRSSTHYTIDLASGPDAAHKAGQERSQLESALPASLYDADIKSIFASQNRIRALKKYLAGYGADPNGIEVIPSDRPAQVSFTTQDDMGDA